MYNMYSVKCTLPWTLYTVHCTVYTYNICLVCHKILYKIQLYL